MILTANDEFIRKLTKVLGMPKYTEKFKFECSVGEIATVECTYHPEINNEETITEKFKLIKIEPEEE